MKANFQDGRRLSPAAQEALRVRAVAAVQGGMSKSEASRVFGVSRRALYNWLERVDAEGKRALKGDRRGRPKGSGAKLKPWQAAQTARLVQDHCPEQLKLPFVLWTREAVGLLIERKWGVKLSLTQVGRYLKRWGFTPQKPVRRAYERDETAVKRWMQEEYPAIAKRAKAEGAEIHWGDEMGLRSDHQAGTSYGRKGKTPVIPGTGKRFRCNMISTITNRGTLRFMVFEGSFVSAVFIEFLKRLLKQSGRRIFLIVDGHSAHVSRETKRWLAAHGERIEVFYLPGYSPELNPDELLNQDVKANALGRRRPRDKADLMANVRGYLRSTQKMPQIVRNFFLEPHVCYAA
ncbi:MAG: IS630 family transposase [Myxococcales bacterium]|nr:MAG: IS630 family transposase [Myxococcales bacterium]